MISLLFAISLDARAVDVSRRQALRLFGASAAVAKFGLPTTTTTTTAARAVATAPVETSGWATSRYFRKYLIQDQTGIREWDAYLAWRSANMTEVADPTQPGRTLRIFISPLSEDFVLEQAARMSDLEDELSRTSGLSKNRLWARIDDRAVFVDFCQATPWARVSDEYLADLATRVGEISPSLGEYLSQRFSRTYCFDNHESIRSWRGRVWGRYISAEFDLVNRIETETSERLGVPIEWVWEEASYLLRPAQSLPWDMGYRPRARPVSAEIRNELLRRAAEDLPKARLDYYLNEVETNGWSRYSFDPDFITHEALDALERDLHERFPEGIPTRPGIHDDIAVARARLDGWAPVASPTGFLRVAQVAGDVNGILDGRKAEEVAPVGADEVAPTEVTPVAQLEHHADCSLELEATKARAYVRD